MMRSRRMFDMKNENEGRKEGRRRGVEFFLIRIAREFSEGCGGDKVVTKEGENMRKKNADKIRPRKVEFFFIYAFV